MTFPANLLYTPEHEWIRFEADDTAVVGITDFAQSELGDIVFVDIQTEGQALGQQEIFGTVEAVKTVSDLFIPISGTILEVNKELIDSPELANTDPYGKGWMIKMNMQNTNEKAGLLGVEAYKALIGHCFLSIYEKPVEGFFFEEKRVKFRQLAIGSRLLLKFHLRIYRVSCTLWSVAKSKADCR